MQKGQDRKTSVFLFNEFYIIYETVFHETCFPKQAIQTATTASRLYRRKDKSDPPVLKIYLCKLQMIWPWMSYLVSEF